MNIGFLDFNSHDVGFPAYTIQEHNVISTSVQRLGIRLHSNIKILIIRTPEKFVVITLKFEQGGFIIRVAADGTANIVDSDQTAPLEAVWPGSALFALPYLSENLGSLRYFRCMDLSCLFDLKSYFPVNTIKVIWSWSVNLHILFLFRLRPPKAKKNICVCFRFPNPT